MRFFVLAVVASLCTGCVHTLPEPVVTNISYDEHGTLVATKCPVQYWTTIFGVSSIEISDPKNDNSWTESCHTEPVKPGAPAASAK
jgi:hypothetical protein